MEEIQHFTHKHPLILLQESQDGDKDLHCSGCDEIILSGPYYSCRECNFILDKSCADLPFEISHRFHKKHPLFLSYYASNWKCDKCEDSIPGFKYYCYRCEYTLDLKCALSAPPIFQKEMTAIFHPFHEDHPLILSKLSNSPYQKCSACRLSFSGENSHAYCCLSCAFYLHKPCAQNIEMTIKKEEFHPEHTLTALITNTYVTCACCKTNFKGIAYCCSLCSFYLHVDCAKLQFPINFKHRCHPKHQLYYFTNYEADRLVCDVCFLKCKGSFYRCVICDVSIHLECVPLPQIVLKYKHHKHGPLKFVDGHVESDGNGLFYCASCEMPRNPDHHIYFCEDCPFEVDINCLMEEEGKTLEVGSYLVPKHGTASVQHFSHRHHLEAIDQGEIQGQHCNGCSDIITGSAYCCKDCNFYLHKSCFDMPFEISHPFHKKHSLFLSYWTGIWSCGSGKCSNDQNIGFAYYCYRCEFTLGLKCASKLPKHESTSVQHFSHRHPLVVIDEELVQGELCSGCSKIITGPAYYCRESDFYLHTSCYDMPFEISHPYHENHPLFLSYWSGTWSCSSGKCKNDQNIGFAYYCYRCEFTLGLKCASQVLKQHGHKLDPNSIDHAEEEQENVVLLDTEEQELDIHHKEPTVAELLETIRILQLELDATKEELELFSNCFLIFFLMKGDKSSVSKTSTP